MKRPKRWIFFFQESGHTIPKYIKCIGTGSVILVNGRLSKQSIELRVTNGYYPIPKNAIAFAIYQGEKTIDTRRITPIRLLSNKRHIED